MTPKEELIYRYIVKEGPCTYTDIRKFLNDAGHSNGQLIDRLVSDGFITKKACKHCKRDGVLEVVKKKKSKRPVPRMSKIKRIS